MYEIKKNGKNVFIRICQFCDAEYLSEDEYGNCCDSCLKKTKDILLKLSEHVPYTNDYRLEDYIELQRLIKDL